MQRVGWVEWSETHRQARLVMMGFANAQPILRDDHTAIAGLRQRSQISSANAVRITGKINSLIACQPK